MAGNLMNTGIYQITNTVDGKRYIGSSFNVEKRKSQHFAALKAKRHGNRHLQSAFVKYGRDCFDFSLKLICREQDLLFYEQLLIDKLNPEYNLCPVAGNTAGRKFTEETKDKIRQKQIGRKHNRTDEHRKKLSEALKGKLKSPEHMAALQAGRKAAVYTEERRQKVSEYLKKQYENGTRSRERSSEYRAKIGKAFADLTDEQVKEIRRLHSIGFSGAELARTYEKPASTISQIVKLKRYAWVK